jgi:hypothetical protein
MINYIVDVYDKNGIVISRQITEEQYNIYKDIKENGQIHEELEMCLENGEYKKNIYHDIVFLNKIDPINNLQQKKDKDKSVPITTSISLGFIDYKGMLFIFTDTLISVELAKDTEKIKKIVDFIKYFYIRDNNILKEWGIIRPKKDAIQEYKINKCNCNLIFRPFSDLLKYTIIKNNPFIIDNQDKDAKIPQAPINKNLKIPKIDEIDKVEQETIEKTNKLINDTLLFIKNLSLTEFKLSKYDCIHFNTIIAKKNKIDFDNNLILNYCVYKYKEFFNKNEEDGMLFLSYN